MKKWLSAWLTLLMVFLGAWLTSARSAPETKARAPAVTRWMDPSGRPPPLHAVPRDAGPARLTPMGFARAPQASARSGAATSRVCVVVHSNVCAALARELEQYLADLGAAGFVPELYRYDAGSAPELRAYLAGLYSTPASLAGAVLIGDIPHIVFEMNDWIWGWGYTDFPCDIFYMDLNGTWLDLTNAPPFAAGKYDTWQGDLDVEIWVSRLKPSPLASLGAETALLKNYFSKDHRYRQRLLVPDRRALAYIDDDWTDDAANDAHNLARIYGDDYAGGVMDVETTTAAEYITNRMNRSYEMVFLRSHGYSGGHGFYYSGRTLFDYAYVARYRELTPPALFYSFFVCSGSDYMAADNLAGTAAFNTNDAGLLSWGSTKTGGMWGDSYFYEPLAAGACFGEAFKQWYNAIYPIYPVEAPSWWYGMVLIGDGALRPASGAPAPTNLAAVGGAFVSQWAAAQGRTYRLEASSGLAGAGWTGISAYATATNFWLAFTDTNAAPPLRIYRLAEQPHPPNRLRNASFEIPGNADTNAYNWAWYAPDEHGSTWDNVCRVNWRARGGEWAAAIRGTWAGAGYGGWWQDAVAEPATTYQASAWFWADQGCCGGVWTAAVQELKLEFYAASFGEPLSVATTRLDGVGEHWTQKTVQAKAPAGTAWARFVVGVSGAGPGGALQFDNACLSAAP